MRRRLLPLLIAVSFLAPAASARAAAPHALGVRQAGPGKPVTTTATAHGITLALTIPSRAYPRNALVRVHVRLTNGSKHVINYWAPGVAPPGVSALQAQVLDGSGHVLFPPAMPFMPPLPGPPPGPFPVARGKSIDLREYIILAGPQVRAAQPIWLQPPGRVALPSVTLATRSIRMTLTDEPPPALRMTGSGSTVAADVTPPSYAHGLPLAISYADCGFPQTYSYEQVWTPSPTHLTPGCAPLKEWHLRLAWLNHPVVALDYSSGADGASWLAELAPTRVG